VAWELISRLFVASAGHLMAAWEWAGALFS